ncbi:MAG: metalloregulator ArsR/SmtB family transcription factor [Kofleriaceae bacterium]
MTEMFAALAELNRFKIVELLRRGPLPVGTIGKKLDLDQPQVSKHLAVLKRAGLVDVEAKAQQRVYELRGKPLAEMHDWLESYRRIWDARFDALERVVMELETAPKKKGAS